MCIAWHKFHRNCSNDKTLPWFKLNHMAQLPNTQLFIHFDKGEDMTATSIMISLSHTASQAHNYKGQKDLTAPHTSKPTAQLQKLKGIFTDFVWRVCQKFQILVIYPLIWWQTDKKKPRNPEVELQGPVYLVRTAII